MMFIVVLDYLSLSSTVVKSANEVGNEYIQEATAIQRSFPKILLSSKEIRELSCGDKGSPQRGIASWYGPGFDGRKMANGKTYDMEAMTVAHRLLPLGTKICIKNPENERIVLATVTDRGPYIDGRIVDLSKGIARKLGILDKGIGKVEIYRI